MLTRSIVVLTVLSFPVFATAATAPKAVTSPFGGNGHNVTFDGRLFIVATSAGWEATVFRPQSVANVGGFPEVSQAFAPFTLVQPSVSNENALAMCEETPQPVRCDVSGAANSGGAYACYTLTIIDSDALAQPPANVMRTRKLRVVVSQPDTANAQIDSHTWISSTPVALSPALRGIEPTVTKDGKLLVWQGVPSNTGEADTIVYSVNSTACGASGWTAPKSITAMTTDPLVKGKYALAERPLRGADGTVFSNNQLFYGAYPWIFPSGEAINFTATPMPCRTQAPNEDPPGCGPRRNALSVIGYPTNWQLAHIDGAVNPDRENQVRLFFSSPGPNTFNTIPLTAGLDVWPFFGSNTSNYSEVIFDDALDGKYGGLWHMNELVTNGGVFDLSRTPDSSGYSNTGRLVGGASLPAANNGQLGKAAVLNGSSGRVEVNDAISLKPVNAITIELWVKPASDPDCDTGNNYRLLLSKGGIGAGSYTIVFEENRDLQARVRVAGGVQYDLAAGTTLPVGQWSHVAVQYDAATGAMAFVVNGVETNRVTRAPALLMGTTDKLNIGGPAAARAACPNGGDGYFHGEVDEVAVSSVWRYGAPPNPVVDAGTPVVDAGTSVDDAGTQIADAGTQIGDAGTTGADAGTGAAGSDEGTSAVDAGATKDHSDAGASVVDPGAAMTGAEESEPGANDDDLSAEAVGGLGCSSGGAPMAGLALLIVVRMLMNARCRENSRAALRGPKARRW